MAKPTYYPDWATVNTTLPATGKANKVRPKETIRTIGWDKGQIPTAEEFNWQMNNYGAWIHYLVDEFIPTLPTTYLPLTGTKVTFSGDLTGNITWNGNKAVTSNVQVVDNSHNHLTANITDATSLPTPYMAAKRGNLGDVSFGRAVNNYAPAGSNADYNFIDAATGVKKGACSWSRNNAVNLYVGEADNQLASINLLAAGYAIISKPRSGDAQETNGASLVRYDYLNTRIAGVNDSINTINTNYVRSIRLGSTYTKIVAKDTPTQANSGGVMIGWMYEGENPGGDTIYYKPVQYNINGTWYTAGQI